MNKQHNQRKKLRYFCFIWCSLANQFPIEYMYFIASKKQLMRSFNRKEEKGSVEPFRFAEKASNQFQFKLWHGCTTTESLAKIPSQKFFWFWKKSACFQMHSNSYFLLEYLQGFLSSL